MNTLFETIHNHKLTIVLLLVILVIGTTSVWGVDAFVQSMKAGQQIDLLNRAEGAITKNQYAEAFNLLDQALAITPNDTEIITRRGDVAFLNGDFALAMSLYRQANITTSTPIQFYEALKFLAQADITKALEALKTLPTNEQKPVVSAARIQSLIQILEPMQTLENKSYQKAQIARTLIDQSALALAETVLKELLKSQPNYRDAHYLLAVVYTQNENSIDALTEINKALKIDPNYQPALELLDLMEKS